VLAGLDASVLSQSRGGWLALLLSLPLALAWLFLRRRETFRAVGLGVAAIVIVLVVLNGGVLMERVERMEHEIQTYDQHGEAGNSVGQRLEHWRFAWDIARERPLLGWGFAGYMAEKAARVAAGRYHPSIVEYKFVHNELLDQWVKLGIMGPAMLLLFYALPLAMFLPKRVRMKDYERDAELGAHALALRLCGTCIPVLYIGFGLTQVFLRTTAASCSICSCSCCCGPRCGLWSGNSMPCLLARWFLTLWPNEHLASRTAARTAFRHRWLFRCHAGGRGSGAGAW
jgi:O-antigen ligase